MNLPPQFRQTITRTFGSDGTAWLNNLPSLITDCERRWSMTAGPHFKDLSYNYVTPARLSDGTEIVLKLGVPRDELLTEAAALEQYGGIGSACLIDAKPEEGILLLERLIPGEMLVSLWPDQDDKATRIAAVVMRQLWRSIPIEHNFITVEDWFMGFGRLRREFNGGSGPFPTRLVNQAESLYAELQSSMSELVLLHGDLHHFNILSSTRRPWLAIDPKGVAGEAAYETGVLLRNPVPHIFNHPQLRQLLERRAAILAEFLDMDKMRIIGWGLAQAVLSAWWDYEDGGTGWAQPLTLAATLSELI